MKIDKGLIGGSTALLLLSLLEERDRYGYEIIRDLEALSDQTFQFKEGTLYPVLHKMENSGILSSYRMKGETGKERKYYRLTRKGQEQLIAEKQQWKVFKHSVDKVIGGEVHEIL